MWILSLLGTIIVCLIKFLIGVVSMAVILPIMAILSLLCAAFSIYITYWLGNGIFLTIQYFYKGKEKRIAFKDQIWEWLFSLDLDKFARTCGEYIEKVGKYIIKSRDAHTEPEEV